MRLKKGKIFRLLVICFTRMSLVTMTARIMRLI